MGSRFVRDHPAGSGRAPDLSVAPVRFVACPPRRTGAQEDAA